MKKLMQMKKGQLIMDRVRVVSRNIIKSKSGEGFVDSAVKILISVVIGALLLAGLYTLFGDVILPELNDRINDMFDFQG